MRATVCAIVAVIGLVAHPALAQPHRTAAPFWKTVQATCDATAACVSAMSSCDNGCNATNDGCLAHCASDADCVSTDYCSSAGGGTCTARHGNGTSCTTEDCQMSPCNYCSSGNCVATGQCCQQTTCVPDACSDSGNSTPSQQTVSNCNTGTCSGMTTSCGTYLCDPASKLCRSACAADTDCLTGNYCDNTGHCVAETLKKGDTCDDTVCKVAGCRQCQTDNACGIPPGKCP